MPSVLEKIVAKRSPRSITDLPGRSEPSHHPQQTPGIIWHHCPPTPVEKPQLIAYFDDVATLLGLTKDDMQQEAVRDWLAGNGDLTQTTPYATCYGGHQFGHWAGQLGDGRAISIAELTHQQQHWELQLKGAGPTPYSRGADGRAVLRSSIREFLCSEAMHHLGIPTTRALSLISTGESVIRDQMYDGHPAPEPGAIVCRVAPSFIRFGHFEILAARQETEQLNQLIDFTLEGDFSHITGNRQQKLAAWFSEICQRTANLIVQWQRVGFVHGVMNTDNMSILGLTIDYGPYGWLDHYDPHWTPNTTDAAGRRYCFGRQPAIARWNLTCLANALASVVEDHSSLKLGIEHYDSSLNNAMFVMQSNKFGIDFHDRLTANEKRTMTQLINRAYHLMQQSEMDFTLFFQQLAHISVDAFDAITAFEQLNEVFYDAHKQQQTQMEWLDWLTGYARFIKQQGLTDQQRHSIMQRTNPQFVLRNYLAQQAIEKAEKGHYNELIKLMQLLKQPYQLSEQDRHYAQKRPQWAANKVGCSMLSCSS